MAYLFSNYRASVSFDSPDFRSELPCALSVCTDGKRVTFSIRIKIKLLHYNKDHKLFLAYEPANLLQGECKLTFKSERPQRSRRKTKTTSTLRLQLKKPCDIWVPRDLEVDDLIFEQGSRFQQFTALVRAEVVHIEFTHAPQMQLDRIQEIISEISKYKSARGQHHPRHYTIWKDPVFSCNEDNRPSAQHLLSQESPSQGSAASTSRPKTPSANPDHASPRSRERRRMIHGGLPDFAIWFSEKEESDKKYPMDATQPWGFSHQSVADMQTEPCDAVTANTSLSNSPTILVPATASPSQSSAIQTFKSAIANSLHSDLVAESLIYCDEDIRANSQQLPSQGSLSPVYDQKKRADALGSLPPTEYHGSPEYQDSPENQGFTGRNVGSVQTGPCNAVTVNPALTKPPTTPVQIASSHASLLARSVTPSPTATVVGRNEYGVKDETSHIPNPTQVGHRCRELDWHMIRGSMTQFNPEVAPPSGQRHSPTPSHSFPKVLTPEMKREIMLLVSQTIEQRYMTTSERQDQLESKVAELRNRIGESDTRDAVDMSFHTEAGEYLLRLRKIHARRGDNEQQKKCIDDDERTLQDEFRKVHSAVQASHHKRGRDTTPPNLESDNGNAKSKRMHN